MHRKLHTDRDGSPSRVLLFLALVTVAVVATPLVFLLSETIGQPYEQIRSAFPRPRTLSLIVTTVGLVVAVIAGTLAIGIATAFLLARGVFLVGDSGRSLPCCRWPSRPTSRDLRGCP